MNKILVVVIAVSLAMVLGCGKEPEQEAAGSRIQPETAGAPPESLAADVGAEAGMPKTEQAEEISKPSPQKSVREAEAKPVEVGDATFESEVLKSEIPVLVDFWAPWCGPCRMAAPVLEKVAKQYTGRVKVCKLNVDEARGTAMRYGIRSIPTLIMYKDGQVVDQIVGVLPNYEAELKKRIESQL
jgi:thioredoxin 1